MTERPIKAQVGAATEIVNDNNEELQTLWSKPASVSSFAAWQNAYQTKAQEILRGYFAEVSKIETDMVRLMEGGADGGDR